MRNFILLTMIMSLPFLISAQVTKYRAIGDFGAPSQQIPYGPNITTLFTGTDAYGLPWFPSSMSLNTFNPTIFTIIENATFFNAFVVIEHSFHFVGHSNIQFRITGENTLDINYLFVDISGNPANATQVSQLNSGQTISNLSPLYNFPGKIGDIFVRLYYVDQTQHGEGRAQWRSDEFPTWTTLDTNDANINNVAPITLIHFQAQEIDDSKVQLTWQTASEHNNDFFEVQRSNNGENWELVTRKEGAGTSTALLNYDAMDDHPYSGTSFYRILQQDFNDNTSYSAVQHVILTPPTGHSLHIYPNPSHQFVTLEASPLELERVKIYNILGQDFTSMISFSNQSNRSIQLDLSALQTGMYFIKTKSYSQKVFKK